MSTITYREMSIEDYGQVSKLWAGIDSLVLSEADSQEQIASYLTRNQGLSFVGLDGDTVIATILCGHDGRRGFIYHVAVSPAYRGRKIGNQLVERSLERLKAEGIDKCHLFVLEDNELGGQFWTAVGWKKRSGFFVYSKDL